MQLLSIFFTVVAPVFGLVILGYLTAKPLGLQARTLSRAAYYIFIPSFIFNVISSAETQANALIRMIGYIVIVHIAIAFIGYLIARTLKLNPKMTAAYVIIAVFGNVGNFGLPIIEFHLGATAILPATIYFLGILTTAFIICVAVASYAGDGQRNMLSAISSVLKTPALLAILPALLANSFNITPPLLITRMTTLLGNAMIPVMLLSLGVQLANSQRIRLSRDIVIASTVRLVGGALLAIVLVIPFGLNGIERGTGIIQSAMPAAVLCSIIAIEYDVEPDFVTQTVLFSTIASVGTLTLLLTII